MPGYCQISKKINLFAKHKLRWSHLVADNLHHGHKTLLKNVGKITFWKFLRSHVKSTGKPEENVILKKNFLAFIRKFQTGT